MDTIFDKIFSPTKHSETSFIKHLISPRILQKNSDCLIQNMPIECQQHLIGDSLFSSDFDNNTTTPISVKRNLHSLFNTFNHSMLPPVPKVSPSSNLSQEYSRLLSKSIDTVTDSLSDLNIALNNKPQKTMEEQNSSLGALGKGSFSEHLFAVSIADASSPTYSKESPVKGSLGDHLFVSIADASSPKSSEGPERSSFSDHLLVSVADASSPSKKAHFNVTISKTMPEPSATSKLVSKEDCNLAQQMAHRKTKELQKRSKKRRRRQKKSRSSSAATKDVQKPKTQVDSNASQKAVDEDKNCDIVCDVTVSPDSKSVQIVLPNLSSFVVTIESGDEDSDWDSIDEGGWLANDSEFQMSGLFVANFSATSVCPSLAYEPNNQIIDQELSLLEIKLKEVNRVWNEQNVCLETKPKSSPLVSFVADEELEEICSVEMYDRKGEWEIFATERLRFKKRISELEDILRPCLLPDHRAKVYSNLQNSVL